jgi:hypothetical protein
MQIRVIICAHSGYLKKKKKPFRIGRTAGSGYLKNPFRIRRTAGSGYFKNFKESPGFVKDST